MRTALDRLTTREQDILARILRGRRVTTIASELYVSAHTVRNHLRNIFTKLDVHSQAELVEWAHTSGAVEELRQIELEQEATALAAADRAAADHLERHLDDLWDDGETVDLKAMVRAALPLDEQTRDAWRRRMAFWTASSSQSGLVPERERQADRWRERLTERVRKLQAGGRVRSDVPAEEISERLRGLTIGAAIGMLGRSESETGDTPELLAVDAYVDEITTR